jgi:homogentisate 1,2-dioxygenase
LLVSDEHRPDRFDVAGTAFTAARSVNLRTWMYRLRPSVDHHHFDLSGDNDETRIVSSFSRLKCEPNQMRWGPMPFPATPTDFIAGMVTVAGSGDAAEKKGVAIHVFAANRSMERSFYNADGDLLVVAQEGAMCFRTEMGLLYVSPGALTSPSRTHAHKTISVSVISNDILPCPSCLQATSWSCLEASSSRSNCGIHARARAAMSSRSSRATSPCLT